MAKSQNQLFIGRLPRSCKERDLEDIFERYGKLQRCDIKTGLKMSYGFVEYEDRRDAEDAISGEHGRDLMGSRIVVEWARGPKYEFKRDDHRRDDFRRDDYRRDDRRHPPPFKEHYDGGRQRSRSRSPAKDYREPRKYSDSRYKGGEEYKVRRKSRSDSPCKGGRTSRSQS